MNLKCYKCGFVRNDDEWAEETRGGKNVCPKCQKNVFFDDLLPADD